MPSHLRSSLILALLLACLSSTRASAEGTLSGSRPNIVIILADDLSYYDLSYLGQEHFQTPNLDRLAAEGLVFTEAYAGSCECAPSRGSLMTGMHMGHCRIRANFSRRGQDYLEDEDQTIAEVLQAAGYATGFVGKWGIGLPGSPGTPDRQGFDYSFGFYDQRRAHNFFPEYLMENGRRVPLPENVGFNMDRVYARNKDKPGNHDNTYDAEGRLVPDGVADPARASYSEYLVRDAALRFIRDQKDGPFFLYYATQLPHGPLIAPELGPYRDKPWDILHKEWAAMVHTMDQSIGLLVAELDRQGVRDNTIIFFASDNGYSQWGYFNRGRWKDDPLFQNKGPWNKGKFVSSDGGSRVPLLVNWPGKVPAGSTDHVTALYDLLATAAELAGVEPHQGADGLSLVPLLSGQRDAQPAHDYLYWENGTMSPHAQAARFDHWYAYRPHAAQRVQLYNLAEDVGCKKNVAQAHPELIERAIAIFTEAHTDSRWYPNPADPR